MPRRSTLVNRKRSFGPGVAGRNLAIRSLVSITLAMLLFATSLPPVVAASLAREAAMRSQVIFQGAITRTNGWLETLKGRGRGTKKGTQQGPPTSTGVKPQPPPSKSQREARVASLRINPKGDVTLESGQPMLFSAVPLDNEGGSIQGLASEWQTSDKEVLSVTKTGSAVAGKPGRATLTASAGQVTQTAQVTVVEATKDGFGGKKQDSTRHKSARQNSNPRNLTNPLASSDRAYEKRHHVRTAALSTALPERPADEDPLPDDETTSLYGAANAIGSPPGKKKPGALTPPTAISGTESGNQNFTFGLPVVGLSGRGLRVSLSLVYNSQLWNKSIDPGDSSTWMSYDVDSGWPAQGFRLGFGQIEDQGSYGFTLTDPDGTRHALAGTGYDYDTTDGTFIHYHGCGGWGTLYYPDGTIVDYGAGGGGLRLYPTKITDRNGNYIQISYAGTDGAGPKLALIRDTLQRYVNFYYATNGDLVTITVPGLSGDLQTMRFYYDDVTIPSSGLFGSGVNVSGAPSTLHTLKYVYLPTSSDGSGPQHIGYKFL